MDSCGKNFSAKTPSGSKFAGGRTAEHPGARPRACELAREEKGLEGMCYSGGQKTAKAHSSNRAGEMAEWLKAHAWKACMGETPSRVRIPVSPPDAPQFFRRHLARIPKNRGETRSAHLSRRLGSAIQSLSFNGRCLTGCFFRRAAALHPGFRGRSASASPGLRSRSR